MLKKHPQFHNAQRSSDIIVYFALLEMMRTNQYGSPEPRLVKNYIEAFGEIFRLYVHKN